MLQLDAIKPAASVLWETSAKPTTTISTPMFQDDGCFYAILGNGSLGCLDAATGKELWTSREPTSESYGNAHITPNGDRVFLFNHTGHLILARLTPKGYQELGRCLLVEPTAGYRAQGPITWAHPAYANRNVFARNDRELVCASLAAAPALAIVPPSPAVPARVLPYFDKDAALGLAFSPDGKTLAAGTWQGLVRIIDLATTNELPAPKPHNDWVQAVAFSPDGRLLVSAGGSEFKKRAKRRQNQRTSKVVGHRRGEGTRRVHRTYQQGLLGRFFARRQDPGYGGRRSDRPAVGCGNANAESRFRRTYRRGLGRGILPRWENGGLRRRGPRGEIMGCRHRQRTRHPQGDTKTKCAP
jgi:hypothetical protein